MGGQTLQDLLASFGGQQGMMPPQPVPMMNGAMPQMAQQPIIGTDPKTISGQIQEALGAKQPDMGGTIQDILAGRFQPPQPTMQDIAQSFQNTIQQGHYAPAAGIAEKRMTDSLSRLADLSKIQKGTDLPSDIQTAEYLKAHPELQPLFFASKRAQKVIDLGGQQMGLDAYGNPINTYQKTVSPNELPSTKAAQEQAVSNVQLEMKPRIAGEVETKQRQSDIATAAPLASETEVGKLQGPAQFDLPRLEQNTDYSIKLLDDLIKHPALKTSVGMYSLLPVIPGTDRADFKSRMDQINGQAFLQAYNTLRGGGQISNTEGDKATAAITRMKTATSDVDFINAAREFQLVLKTGRNRARKQASRESALPQVNENAPGMNLPGANPPSSGAVDWQEYFK